MPPVGKFSPKSLHFFKLNIRNPIYGSVRFTAWFSFFTFTFINRVFPLKNYVMRYTFENGLQAMMRGRLVGVSGTYNGIYPL